MSPRLYVFVAVSVQIFAQIQGRVVLSLYEGAQHTGNHVLFVDSAPDLAVVNNGFDNVASSACVRFSTWILYGNVYYNSEDSGTLGIVYGEIVCENLPPELDDTISSVRHVGYNLSWYHDAINLYQSSRFEGDELLILEDSPILDNPVETKSLIVSGRGQWTLYEKENYEGSNVCVGPQDPENGYPGIYEDFSATVGWIPASARLGCSAQTFIPPFRAENNLIFL